MKHFIGKGGCHLQCLETLTSNFIGLVDSKTGGPMCTYLDLVMASPLYSMSWSALVRGSAPLCLSLRESWGIRTGGGRGKWPV